jgi:hypothetical protein
LGSDIPPDKYIFKCGSHSSDDAARRRAGGEQRLQCPDLPLAHGGVGVLESGPLA